MCGRKFSNNFVCMCVCVNVCLFAFAKDISLIRSICIQIGVPAATSATDLVLSDCYSGVTWSLQVKPNVHQNQSQIVCGVYTYAFTKHFKWNGTECADIT